ncbi:MAG: DUF1064 domain-containing protein [Fluviibacter sp.]
MKITDLNEFRFGKKSGKARYQVVEPARRTMDGVLFASQKEMKRYAELRLLVRAGEITDLALQPKFEVDGNGEPFCVYTADFSYRDKAGNLIVEEIKSTGTAKDAAYKLRKKAAELAFDMTVTEVIR